MSLSARPMVALGDSSDGDAWPRVEDANIRSDRLAPRRRTRARKDPGVQVNLFG
jgi:hypothetical protein